MPAKTIYDHLERAGPSRAPAIQSALGISQSTFHRAVQEARQDLLIVGRARATTYALRRDVEGERTPVPVYEIDPSGASRHALTLHPVEPFGYWVEGHTAGVPDGFHETDPSEVAAGSGLDLPWFLQDARPSGFLGRAWLRAHADQGYPADLARWTGDDTLRYAAHYGTDLVGAFVVGPFALDLLSTRPAVEPVQAGSEGEVYPRQAERVLSTSRWGSSPGGDQPKFTARVVDGDGSVTCRIVKFSPPLDTPGGRRWADLLVAEHLAHEVLRAHDIDAARSSLLDAGGRRFLQVDRFDRHGADGRSGLVSLSPFDRQGVASDLRRWSLVTARLVDQGRLDPAEHRRVEWLEAFGHLIANTDMHPGNLSLRLQGTTIQGLAPVYDMLPMFHAPRHGGELPRGLYEPSAELDTLPPGAREAAAALWGGVEEHERVSEGFREIARRQRGVIAR